MHRPNKEYFNCDKKNYYTRDRLGRINPNKKLKDKKIKQKVKCIKLKSIGKFLSLNPVDQSGSYSLIL